MIGFLYFLIILMGLITLGMGIYLIFINKKSKEEPENQPWIFTYGSQYANGHAIGRVDNIEVGETRIKVDFYPRDINYIREFNKSKRFTIGLQTVFFDKKQVEAHPEGGLSMHSGIIFAYPSRIEDLPLSFRKTRHGQAIINIINENNKLSDESELYKERMNKLKEVASQTFGGGIFENYIDKVREQIKDLSENYKKDEIKPIQPKI